jgi:signal peptidase I
MKLKKVIKYVISAILIVIIAILAYFVTSSIIAQSNNTISQFFGYSIANVPTESMEPTIEKGSTIIFEQKTSYSDLKADDIVVYHSSEKDMYIIHRIISGDTESGFVVQGDNNPTYDTNSDGSTYYLTQSDYIGKYIKTVTVFSINSTLSKGLIFTCCIVVFIIIIASELLNIARLKDSKKDKTIKDNESSELSIDKEALRKELLEELKKEMNNNKDDE